jgi:hypothetical protein
VSPAAGRCGGVDGVEAQTVESIFHQPIQRILDEEASDFRAEKVDRGAPRSPDVVAKELRRVDPEVISVRAEVIVDDIKEDHEAKIVPGIDQFFQIVWSCI